MLCLFLNKENENKTIEIVDRCLKQQATEMSAGMEDYFYIFKLAKSSHDNKKLETFLLSNDFP